MPGVSVKPDHGNIFFNDSPDDSLLKQIETGLGQYNDDTLGLPMEKWACATQDAEGSCIGGITGSRVGDTAFIRWLWVDSAFRKQGLGSQLMAWFENRAKEKDCSRVWVDTGSFQAPDFYRKLGYAQHTVIPDFYAGHDRIFFCKDLLKS